MIETENYIFFFGSRYSQWAGTPFKEGDVTYNTAEQYMMYHKAITFGDFDSAEAILKSQDPAEQKRIGRKVKGFEDERWDLVKEAVVYQANLLKFSQNEQIKKVLTVNHKDKMFVEAAPTDRVWGIGLDLGDSRIFNEDLWQGQNLLGIAIKRVQQRLLGTGKIVTKLEIV